MLNFDRLFQGSLVWFAMADSAAEVPGRVGQPNIGKLLQDSLKDDTAKALHAIAQMYRLRPFPTVMAWPDLPHWKFGVDTRVTVAASFITHLRRSPRSCKQPLNPYRIIESFYNPQKSIYKPRPLIL